MFKKSPLEQRFNQICRLPHSINMCGESCNIGFKKIPFGKIIPEKKEEEISEFTVSEVNSSNLGTLDFKNEVNLKILFNEAYFKSTKKEERYKKSVYYVVKVIRYTLTIPPKYIEFDDKSLIETFKNKKGLNDEELSRKLDADFNCIGFYVPLKIEIGGKIYFKVDELFQNYHSNNSFNLSGNLDFNTIKDKMNSIKLSEENLKSIFSSQQIKIIGGDIYAKDFESWKKTITLDNAQVIGYKNLKPIEDFIPDKYYPKLKGAIELLNKKYNTREEYMKIYEKVLKIKNDKKIIHMKKKGSFQEGECYTRKNPNIFVESYPFKNNGRPFKKIPSPANITCKNIIVGWKIIDNWKDGTNGDWEIYDCPLLSTKINIDFISKIFRGQNFTLEIYVMETPD